MPQKPLDDEKARAAAEAYKANGNDKSAAAKALGIPRNTFCGHLKHAALRGMLGTEPVLPGFEIERTTHVTGADGATERQFVRQRQARGDAKAEMPPGHRLREATIQSDSTGKLERTWWKTKETPSAIDIAETLKAAFADYEPAAIPTPAPLNVETDLVTLMPLNDWHVGMFSWERETGTNWDLKIAERVIGQAIEQVIEQSPVSETAIVLGGGDLTHADNNKNQTARSSNQLDVDGRHQKVVETAGRLVVRSIDAALKRAKRVIVRILKGNHDEETAPSIAWFLLAWYRNEPRVIVDCDQSLFWYYRFGKTFLAATHGHEARLSDMPAIMAHRRPEDWGASLFRYAHGFHVHHKSKRPPAEAGGVELESHQAPIPQDAWHFGRGFLSGRSLQTITYHKDFGEISRVRRALLDAGEPRKEAA
jgi:hypothetical protein